MTSAEDLPVHLKELALIEGYLVCRLRRVMVLVNELVLQHAVLVQDLVIDLLVEEAHGVVRIFAALVSHGRLVALLLL